MEHKEEENKFLIFKVINEEYACNILQIKEVIKCKNIKPIPFMVPYFKGILNLRGKIISIIDFRIKLLPNLENTENEGIILVVENELITIGVIVDDLISVTSIIENEIQKNKDMKYSIDSKFILGNYIYKDKLVTVLDLISSINEEDLKIIKENDNLKLSMNM